MGTARLNPRRGVGLGAVMHAEESMFSDEIHQIQQRREVNKALLNTSNAFANLRF